VAAGVGWGLACCSRLLSSLLTPRCLPMLRTAAPNANRRPPLPCSDAREAVAVLLPLLLDKGIPSNVAEVRGLAVGTLTAAVKAAGAAQVGRAAPAFLPPACLLTAGTLRLAPQATPLVPSCARPAWPTGGFCPRRRPSGSIRAQARCPPSSHSLTRAPRAPLQVSPHLPRLVPALLEALSSLEDARLNYIEQHAGNMGIDAGGAARAPRRRPSAACPPPQPPQAPPLPRLPPSPPPPKHALTHASTPTPHPIAQERLDDARVAASRASPMSDALELCSRYASAADAEALVPELAGIIRRGVGLNTKVGPRATCAWASASLATRDAGSRGCCCEGGRGLGPGAAAGAYGRSLRPLQPVHSCPRNPRAPASQPPASASIESICVHHQPAHPAHPPMARWAWRASSARWRRACTLTSSPARRRCSRRWPRR
jgi:hypothetical protein